MVKQATQPKFLIENRTGVNDADRSCRQGELGHVQRRRDRRRASVNAQTDRGNSGHPERAAHSQQALWPAVIFDGGFDLGFGPGPLANFQVPLAPSLIHCDEIFARQQKLHDGMQETFLFLSTLIPVREIEGAFVPQNAQRLSGAVEFEWLHLTKAAETPAITLQRTNQRSDIN